MIDYDGYKMDYDLRIATDYDMIQSFMDIRLEQSYRQVKIGMITKMIFMI